MFFRISSLQQSANKSFCAALANCRKFNIYIIYLLITINLTTNGQPKGLKDTIRDFIYTDLFPQKTSNDVVSTNSKVVLFGLFALLGFAILTYSITVLNVGTHNTTETIKTDGTTKTVQVKLNDTIQLERLQQLEQVNGVYIAAISGSLALGGTLIAQLWGRG